MINENGYIVGVLHQLSRINPDDSKRGAIESAAVRVGVAPSTAYNWIRWGGVPKTQHLLALLTALHPDPDALIPFAEIRALVGNCAADTQPDT